MDQKSDHIEIDFDYFQIQKVKTVRGGKVYEKHGIICLVSMLSSWGMVPQFSKNLL